MMKPIETGRLIIKSLSEADAEIILPVYLNSADYLDTQTPVEPSLEMVQSDLELQRRQLQTADLLLTPRS